MKTAKIGEFFWIKLDKKEIMLRRACVLPLFEKRFLSLQHACSLTQFFALSQNVYKNKTCSNKPEHYEKCYKAVKNN